MKYNVADITTITIAPFGTGSYTPNGGSMNDAFSGTFIDEDALWTLLVYDADSNDTCVWSMILP